MTTQSPFDPAELLAEWTRVHEAATPGTWFWHWRADDDFAPGAVSVQDRPSIGTAIVMCPRYGRDRFASDAAAITHYHNTYGALLDVVRAVDAQRRASFRIASDKADHPDVREVHEWVHSMMSGILASLTHLTRAAREADGGEE